MSRALRLPAGGLIDRSRRLAFRFDGRGRYPFFCRPHQSFQMLGVVIVGTPTDVRPIDSAVESSGFLGAPVPNPSHGDVVVQFALRTAGRARLEVFDVMGRQIAVPFERDLGTGRWTATWDGRTTAGRAAGAGVYWLRLQVQERVETRRLVLAH